MTGRLTPVADGKPALLSLNSADRITSMGHIAALCGAFASGSSGSRAGSRRSDRIALNLPFAAYCHVVAPNTTSRGHLPSISAGSLRQSQRSLWPSAAGLPTSWRRSVCRATFRFLTAEPRLAPGAAPPSIRITISLVI